MRIKHQSETYLKTARSLGKTTTYYGTRAEVEAFIDATPLGDTAFQTGYYVDKVEGRQVVGDDQWEVDVVCLQAINELGVAVLPGPGPAEHSLSTRMISIPLEGLRASYWTSKGYAYRTNWNYALAALGPAGQPSWWATATSLIIPVMDRENYKWLSNENDVASMPKQDNKYWGILKDKTKPGVEAFQFPVYEITETGRHKTEAQAAWVGARQAGKLFAPSKHTFGITYGNWLCLGGSASFDGKDWVATVTYQHSPVGWDTDLYNKSF